ncbi:hypothetical protein AQUCO_00600094v1 [Aquilegia coerulea]|uniref:Cytochrome P450 n=1 Tax=Aquilegia coerulea TaxID=218851 RepID=A0A2G5EMY9_AQUCA|nr:hypothetical protein AQUCO_00600094v1 [Aquilegia coerulea]
MELVATIQEPLFMLLLFFILPLSFFLGVFVRRRRKLPFPPGPNGLPVIGNMGMADQLTHRGLAQLSKQYGGILHLRLGLLHMVVVSKPEVAREVLQVQDNIFSNRPATYAIRYLTYDRADMAFAHYGPFWRQMRKLCVMKLFSRKRAESWASVQDEVESTVRMVEFSKLFGAFNIADFFPGLSWVDPQGLNARLTKARQSLDRFIDKIIDDHLTKKKKTSDQDDTDMVDDLLAFYKEEAKESKLKDPHISINLTRENIKAIIMDVMFGGTETVASAIEWAMSELLKSPEDLKKVQQELNMVVGLDRRVQESDLDKLTYLKCVLKETLRLHPPIPLLLHETSEDAEVAGYYIPARSRVVINAWAIGRDKNAWDEPEVFKPARFLNKGAPDFKGNNFEFIPFGSGRRSCPGMQLGLYALELAVVHLLHCFSWELPDGMKPDELDMNDVFGLTAPRAIRLTAVPRPRLNCLSS